MHNLFYCFSCLTPDDYNILSAKIISVFPIECCGTYYVPAVRKKDSIAGKPILARGKLVDKCRNLLHACGPVIVRKKSSTETNGYERSTIKIRRESILEDGKSTACFFHGECSV